MNGDAKLSDRQRIHRKVVIDPATGCWNWRGVVKPRTGYAEIQVRYEGHLAHRFSYRTFVGPIPDGLQIDHLCRNRRCVNPAHLEPVTPAENTRRGESFAANNLRKTHCPQGHPYDELNTRRTPSGGRECKECRRETTRRYRQRQAFRAANVRMDGAA